MAWTWTGLTDDQAPLRTLDSGFPMQKVAKIADWPVRKAEIRLRTLVAAGLHPMPKKSPLRAILHGKVERPDYSVERVILESFPGHFVTGSLYRPRSGSGKRPALLSPHGHWKNGRFHAHEKAKLEKEIATGGERFVAGGRHPIQARCVQLSRMGCIVFVYDMVGYADSIQLEHRNPLGPGLLYSPQAELQGQTIFGLQTWNSIRALDFISSLPDVDPARIGVTGASGGGTQTMVLAAVDSRIAASFPAVMVSESMQGGCTCENAPNLRISQGNIDIAAAAAPAALGLIAADDWTSELETKGHPDLRSLYMRLGLEARYEAHFHTQFSHNYNAVNRKHLYHFVNRHFRLGLNEPIEERDFVPLDPDTEASVWTDEHPMPSGDQIGAPHERKLLAAWREASAAALASLSEAERIAVIREGVAVLIGARSAESASKPETILKLDFAELPESAALTISGNGKHDYQRALCYTYGYNPTPLARAVQQVVEKARQHRRVHILASGREVGTIARLAEAILGDRVATSQIDDKEFSFFQVDRLDHPMMLPGIARYGGMEALRALAIRRVLD
jgi:dienelactone hydrolase